MRALGRPLLLEVPPYTNLAGRDVLPILLSFRAASAIAVVPRWPSVGPEIP